MLYRFLRNDAWLSLPQIGSVLKGKEYKASISHMNNSTPHFLRTVPTLLLRTLSVHLEILRFPIGDAY